MMAKEKKAADRMERKTIEKNRRMHMKGLCFKLASLVSRDAAATPVHKEERTQLDHLDEATAYIKKLQARIEDLHRRKETALVVANGGCCNEDEMSFQQLQQEEEQEPLPLVDVRALDSVLEVVLVYPADESGDSFQRFYKAMAALEEEGAKVANASFSVVNDKMFSTIHAQVAIFAAGIEEVSAVVADRLRKLIS